MNIKTLMRMSSYFLSTLPNSAVCACTRAGRHAKTALSASAIRRLIFSVIKMGF